MLSRGQLGLSTLVDIQLAFNLGRIQFQLIR